MGGRLQRSMRQSHAGEKLFVSIYAGKPVTDLWCDDARRSYRAAIFVARLGASGLRVRRRDAHRRR